MSNLPSSFVKLRILKELPIAEYAQLQAPKDLSNTQARLGFLKFLRKPSTPEPTAAIKTASNIEYDSALWLRFVNKPSSPISLWLCYKDESGKGSVLVDEQLVDGSKSLMLSGAANLKFKGDVEYVRVCCGGLTDEDRFSVDELFIKRLESSGSNTIQQRRAG